MSQHVASQILAALESRLASVAPVYLLPVHAVALARVAADLLPFGTMPLMLLAAVGWLLTLLVWGGQVIPIYLAPRPDGKAG